MDPLTTSPAMTTLSPLSMRTRWASRAVVGREAELTAVRQELAVAKSGRLAAMTLEGEPGIGKSRLLIAATQAATEEGFLSVAVSADEELRGPFLLARSLFAAREAHDGGDAASRTALARALGAVTGQETQALEGLPADQRVLRAYDLGAVAIRALAEAGPLALFFDDLQWGDEDSVRMLRYIIRAASDIPLFLMIAVRPEEMASAAEVTALVADMQRMGMVRRLQLARLSQAESAELVRQVLGGDLDQTSAVTIHAQAEGVPFILEEIARTYLDTGLIQQVDGVWRLARNAERLIPSAVRTLINRRAAHLPLAARTLLAEAAVIGRFFSLKDLQALKTQLDEDGPRESVALASMLAPAVAMGLLTELPQSAPADYRFAHEQVREFAVAMLTSARRREIHGAVVDLLTAEAEPHPDSLALLAQHALAAGDTERAARFACEAASAALAARAPEEALRMVELALPSVLGPHDRISLLTSRDDALDMLRQPTDRLETLAELGALAEAIHDRHLLFQVTLRRAAALRQLDDADHAARLAAQVRADAAEEGDRAAELAAAVEQGQAFLGRSIGESFSPPGSGEADLDRAAEAYQRAAELAAALGDEARLAAVTRELGVIDVGRARALFLQLQQTGAHLPLLERIAAGERAEDVMAVTPIAPVVARAQARFAESIEMFDRLGDRAGLMSSIIAMAYLPFALDIHLNGSAQRIEEIRRLATELASLTRESERDHADAQMLYGAHVFARAKGVADLALTRGAEAFGKSRLLGDRDLEFAAAGGVALSHLDLGEVGEAETWVGRAAAVAASTPTPFRTRQLALWRGMLSSGARDPDSMVAHLERAADLAAAQGRPAARCEALACLALQAAGLGEQDGAADLLPIAEGSAARVADIAATLPGHPLWPAQAAAALALVALAKGDVATAAERAREALGGLRAAALEDLNLDIVIPAARGIMAGGTPQEQEAVLGHVRLTLSFVAQRILDDEIRARWFRGPLGHALSTLVGSAAPASRPAAVAAELDDDDARLLALLVGGQTNREIAAALGVDEHALPARLAGLHARIGTSTRAEATAFAFRERVV